MDSRGGAGRARERKGLMKITSRLWLTLVWVMLVVLPMGSGLPVIAASALQNVDQSIARLRQCEIALKE